MKLLCVKDKILAMLAISILCFSTKKFYSFVQVNKVYSLNINSYISQEAKENLKQVFKKRLVSLKTTQIPFELKDTFNFIDKIVVKKTNPYKCQIDVSCSRPKLLINSEYVLTAKNKLLNANIFNNCTLNNIEIKNIEDVKTKEFKSFVDVALEQQIFDDFEVIWVNKNSIYLQDKQNIQMQFLGKFDKLPNKKEKTLLEKFINEKGSKKGARADLRFVDQVVISFV